MTIIGTPTATVFDPQPFNQPSTFADLYTDLLNRVRVATSAAASVVQAKRYINTALHDMAMGNQYKMPWLEREGRLITHAPYTDGTVTISQGTTALTGSSTLWDTNNAYGVKNMRTTGKVTIGGSLNIYRIGTITSDTAATCDTFAESSNASGASYIYFEDEYDLAGDFLRPVNVQSFSDAFQIPLVDRNHFRRRYPRPNVSGRPKVATIVERGYQTTGLPLYSRRVQFYPYPDATYVIPYQYITLYVGVDSLGTELQTLEDDTDIPHVPLRYRHLIVLHALKNWYRDKKDDARSQEVNAEYTDGMLRMLSDFDIGSHPQAQIQPQASLYSSWAQRPWSRRGGRIMDINGEFDRFIR